MLSSSRLSLPLWLLALRLPPPPPPPPPPLVLLVMPPLLLLAIPLLQLLVRVLLVLVLPAMSRVTPLLVTLLLALALPQLLLLLLLEASVASGVVPHRRCARPPAKGLRFQLRFGQKGCAASRESRLQRGPGELERSAAVRPTGPK